MVRETTCDINLNPVGSVSGVFYSGQEIIGNVLLTFYEPQIVKGM